MLLAASSSSMRFAAMRSRSRHRPFFSFASPSKALVKSHQETKVVPFSPEEMFDVVADVNKYHEFLPFCVESRVLRQPNDNVMEAALRIGFKVFTESYTSRVIMKRYGMRGVFVLLLASHWTYIIVFLCVRVQTRENRRQSD